VNNGDTIAVYNANLMGDKVLSLSRDFFLKKYDKNIEREFIKEYFKLSDILINYF
jgi:hypothetical protein